MFLSNGYHHAMFILHCTYCDRVDYNLLIMMVIIVINGFSAVGHCVVHLQ